MAAARKLPPAGGRARGRDRPLTGLPFLLCALLLLAACGGEAPPASRQTPPPDPLAHASKPRISAAAPPSVLEVTLAQGEYVSLGVEPDGSDPALTWFGPGGDRLLRIDSLTGSEAREEIHWVAETAGVYRAELTPGDADAGSGMHLDIRRPATEEDRRRARAEKALAAGHEKRRASVKGQGRDDRRGCREAVARYREAEHLFAELEAPERRAETLFGLGLVRRSLDESEAAFGAFLEAADLTGNPWVKAKAHQQAAAVAFELGELNRAADLYEQTLEPLRRSGDRGREAISANNLGDLYHLLGRWDDARSLLERAESLWQQLENDGERANTLQNLGRLERDLGETDSAQEHFELALDLARSAGNRKREAEADGALGALRLNQGRLDEARELLEAALQLHEEGLQLHEEGTQGRAVTLADLGVVYRRLERPDDARRVYTEALTLARDHEDAREEAGILHNLAFLDWSSGATDRALNHCRQALALFAGVFDPAGRANTLLFCARVRRGIGDLRGAREDAQAALGEIEALRSQQRRTESRSAYFATRQDFYDFLIDLLMDLDQREPAEGWDAAALEVAERARARSLLDSLAAGEDPRHGAGLEPLEEELNLEREIDDLLERQERLRGDPGVQGGQVKSAEDEVAETARSLEERLEELRATIRATSPRWASLNQPQPLSADEIRTELEDGTLLLEYRLGPGRSFVWADGPEGMKSLELPAARAEIERLVREVHGLLARSWTPRSEISIRQRLARLGQILLEPVADLLHERRLVIVADGVLQYLPFAVLPLPGDGEPVVSRHEVVALPSISALAALRRRLAGRPPAPRTLWVLADPAFGGRYPQLPYARQEAESLTALVPDGEATSVLGVRANRHAVLEGGLARYRFLHFATHGRFNAAQPETSKLVLAQLDEQGLATGDGALSIADVYRLQIDADLVVLSACSTALGEEVRGEGLVGMTQGFLHAGAERVVVSLWNVSDRVTKELMERFYRGMLQEGLTPAAALRSAQQAVRLQPRWQAPYYWAGFVLQGEWRGLRFPPG